MGETEGRRTTTTTKLSDLCVPLLRVGEPIDESISDTERRLIQIVKEGTNDVWGQYPGKEG